MKNNLLLKIINFIDRNPKTQVYSYFNILNRIIAASILLSLILISIKFSVDILVLGFISFMSVLILSLIQLDNLTIRNIKTMDDFHKKHLFRVLISIAALLVIWGAGTMI
jgi:hypothetical protein